MRKLDTYEVHSPEETIRIAAKLADLFKSGDVVLLEGDLGSGKTFLVQAICRIWQTEDEASSPTFAIIQQYRGERPVNHMDFYRIEQEEELDNLGWEEYLDDQAVTFIEWPQIIEEHLDRFYKLNILLQGLTRKIELYQTEEWP